MANVVTLHITQATVRAARGFALLPCVICYKATPDGKIASLRAFWETGNIPWILSLCLQGQPVNSPLVES